MNVDNDRTMNRGVVAHNIRRAYAVVARCGYVDIRSIRRVWGIGAGVNSRHERGRRWRGKAVLVGAVAVSVGGTARYRWYAEARRPYPDAATRYMRRRSSPAPNIPELMPTRCWCHAWVARAPEAVRKRAFSLDDTTSEVTASLQLSAGFRRRACVYAGGF